MDWCCPEVPVRSARLAEAIVSLVIAPDRSVAAVGDLVEGAGGRGRVWFWTSIAHIALSSAGRDLLTAPIAMAVSAALAWFPYMALCLALAFAGYVAATLAWGVAYFFTHQTGLELLTNVVRLLFDWTPLPAWRAMASRRSSSGRWRPFRSVARRQCTRADTNSASVW